MHRRMRLAGARALALLLALGVAGSALPVLADGEPRLTGTVNINTASVEELQLLPGIGESRAQAVVAERKRRGGFKRVDDLLDVKGIGASSLERMKPHVSVSGKTTARIE
jgi:competence protein ComEA